MAHCTAIAEAGGVQKYSNSLLSLVKLSAEDREEMGYVQTEAKAAMDEYIAIFVKEGVTDESWNAYVKIFEDMGCDKFVKLYQEGLDQLVIE